MIGYRFVSSSNGIKLTLCLKARNELSARKKIAKLFEKKFKVKKSLAKKLAQEYLLSYLFHPRSKKLM